MNVRLVTMLGQALPHTGRMAVGEDRAEGWFWWLVLVSSLVVIFLILNAVRRRLLRPMSHKPTDTTDSWTEAGRRFALPDSKAPSSEDEDVS